MATILDGYLAQINGIAEPSGIYAYRGQHNAEWVLQSGATRRLAREYEGSIVSDPEFPELYVNYHRDTLLEPARSRGYGVESGRSLSDLELLAKLQHLGASTGLLDFSWNPLVALWFACNEGDEDGKLFMVNTNDAVHFIRLENDVAAERFATVLSDVVSAPRICYWEPPLAGEATHRIIRQRSVFIIGHPLVLVNQRMVSQLLIPKKDKQPLLAELAFLDTTQESLFLDVHGFALASQRRRVPDLTPSAHIRSANKFYQQKEFEQAISHYNEALSQTPTNLLAYFLRGNALAACERHSDAVSDYAMVIEHVSPSDLIDQSVVFFNLGNSKAAMGDHSEAVADYSAAIEIRSDQPEYYFNRGNAYLDLRKFTESIDDYDLVTGHSAGHAYFNKGNALLAMGLLQSAASSYARAAEAGYNSDAINQNLGVVVQILSLLHGKEYEARSCDNPDGFWVELRFSIPGSEQEQTPEPSHFIVYGRAGNSGNNGGPGLEGGIGAMGKPLTAIKVEVQTVTAF